LSKRKGLFLGVFLLVFMLLNASKPRADVHFTYLTYNNRYDGYSVRYPSSWQVDESNKESVVQFSLDGHFKLSIYHQPLKNVSANDYIWYSNKQIIEGKSGVKLLSQKKGKVGKYTSYEFCWKRPYIAGIPNDLNYYREVNLILKNQIFTFIMKSSEKEFSAYSQQLDSLLKSFKIIPQTEMMVSQERKETPVCDLVFSGKDLTFRIPKDGLVWGVFMPGALVSPEGNERMKQLEEDLNHRFDFLMTYCLFGSSLPKEMLESAKEEKRIVMLTWQPWWTNDGQYHATPDIAAGVYDDYIREWARGIKEFGNPVFLRISNEMNGDWDPWCVWFLSLDHDIYKEAWKRIHRIFQEEGADNVQFVWNPHDRSYPNFRWNNPHLYYPGDEYVDWIGLTGYNNGTSYPYDIWRDFDQIYRPIYDDYSNKYPDKPFMIGEFSCNEVGGDKAAWIEEGFASLTKNYPKIRMAVWFNAVDNKWIYTIDSSPEAKEAFKKALTNPYYVQGTVERNQKMSIVAGFN